MKPLIIDTREPYEYQMGHVKGALNLPAAAFTQGLPVPLQHTDTHTPVIVYCRSGARSNVVQQILEHHGFARVTNGISQQHVEKLLKTN